MVRSITIFLLLSSFAFGAKKEEVNKCIKRCRKKAEKRKQPSYLPRCIIKKCHKLAKESL